MKIGIVAIGNDKRVELFKTTFKKNLEKKNHNVTIIDDLTPINNNNHIIFIVDSGKLFGKNFMEELENFLKERDIKIPYCSIFTTQRLFSLKIFVKYMAILEKYGLIIQYSDMLKDISEVNYYCESVIKL